MNIRGYQDDLPGDPTINDNPYQLAPLANTIVGVPYYNASRRRAMTTIPPYPNPKPLTEFTDAMSGMAFRR